MMPTAKGMSHMIPNHVLRVGQTIRLDSEQEAVNKHPSLTQPTGDHGDPDLDISLDNLNQLILELDPTFEPIQVNKSPSSVSPLTADPCSDEEISDCVLVPRGCSSGSSPIMVRSVSPSIPILAQSSVTYGTLSCSPTISLPPLPCGSAPRRNPSPKQDTDFSQGPLRLSQPNRNSATSLLSMSTCSDTSYILGSNLSLASEDDSPESIFTSMSGSCSDVSKIRPFDNRHSPDKPLLTRQEHLHSKGGSSPGSLSGSLTDIPVLLVNGAPEPDLCNHSPGPQTDLMQTIPASSLKPATHTEALVKDKEAGTFVVRDSTSYRGSFGLAMKVDNTATAFSGESSVDVVRHFLIESSAKGVRIKGSSQEPYFACNFIYLNAVPTEMLTGPCAVQRAVSSTFQKAPGSFTPTVVNMKVSSKGVTLTDINRKTFGFVAKGVDAGMENICHVFAEYDPLQPCNKVIEVVQSAIAKL
ncbi:hypothetical protein INR49_031118 [Caranx melampygus]|nr:hypothetical protein INR49_031118 [Caranx melampygus]